MSMNKFMHPRNIYKTPPNFSELASKYPDFKKYAKNKLGGGISFDFKNADGLRCLTKILLEKDFGLDVIVPECTLVPTLPLRLNYILWLEDLLEWNTMSEGAVKGIDIGTGASCIFPLLAAKKNKWKMLGTEINKFSVEAAVENVSRNKLEEFISIKEVSESTFLDGVFADEEIYDFCMCNPPFFSTEEELDSTKKARTDKRKEPSNCRTGIPDEVIAPGGEVEFIKNIIKDSLKLQDRVRIYTTMLGQKSSMEVVVKELESHNLTYCQTLFCQGHTVRWGVAWTFLPIALEDSLPVPQKKAKPITWKLDPKLNFKQCVEAIPQLLTQMKIKHVIVDSFKRRCHWKITAHENTWTGLRKRRRELLRKEKMEKRETVTNGQSIDTSATRIEAAESLNTTGEGSNRKRTFREKEDEADENASKRFKPECSNQEPIVEAVLGITTEKEHKVQLQISYISGIKDAPQQILQYLKNNLLKVDEAMAVS